MVEIDEGEEEAVIRFSQLTGHELERAIPVQVALDEIMQHLSPETLSLHPAHSAWFQLFRGNLG